MNLRSQVGLMLIAVFGCLMVVSMVVQLGVIYPSYERLEIAHARTDLDRCVHAIEREVEYVSKFCIDWSVWNDMYQFAQDGNKAFHDVNLASEDYFRQLNVPVMFICDSEGKVVYSHVRDPETFEPLQLGVLSNERLEGDHPLMKPQSVEEVNGVLLTERGPLLVASRVILQSDHSGPGVGRFIVGRFISDDAIRQLSEQTLVRFHIWTTLDELPEDVAAHMPALRHKPGESLITQTSPSIAHGLRLVPTIVPGQLMILRASLPREITSQGATTIAFGLLSLVVAAACIMLLLTVLLQHRVVSPIVALKEHASTVASSGDLNSQLDMPRADEIGSLTDEFNRMMGRLAEMQESLSQACRQAGMSEVATGVLHNVGNAMTNATVATGQLQRLIDDSRLNGLDKAVNLLRQHEQDFAEFLLQDDRGRQLPEYLMRINSAIQQERSRIKDHMARLQTSLEHISEIVQAQQGLAVSVELVETSRVSSIIAQCVGLVQASYERHGASIRIHVPDDLLICVDRTKLLQVLVNFLTNALHSVKQLDELQRRVVDVEAGMTLCSSNPSQQKIWIEVRDRGVGFDPDQRVRLFAQGYTTRSNGHGVGLHFCAIAVEQMGGVITASSDGPDQGATFRVELPVRDVLGGLSADGVNEERLRAA